MDLKTANDALEAADSLFRLAARQDSDWPNPWFLRGTVVGSRANLVRAAEVMDPGSPLAGGGEDPTALLQQGLDLIEEGLRLDPRSRDGLYAKAELLRLLSANIDDADSMLALGRNIEDALQQAIRGDPPRPDAMLRLAQLRLGQGDFENALDLYERAFERDVFRQRLPNDLLDLGRLRLETRDPALGLEECQEGESGASGWDRYMRLECHLLLLAFGAELEPDVDAAERLIGDPISHGPAMGGSGSGPNPRLLTLYASVLARAGLFDSARSVHGRAISLREGRPLGEYDVGYYALVGDTTDAFRILREQSGFRLNSVIFDPLRDHPAFDSLPTGGSSRR
jgi:tetratricopeptide (TPR) repeat protein